MKNFLFIITMLFLFGSNTAAQELSLPETSVYQEATSFLEELETELKSDNIKTTDTIRYIQELNSLQNTLEKLKQTQEKELSFAQTKLNALGALPAEAEKEEITHQRQSLEEENTQIKTQMAQVDLALAKIDEMNGRILKLRNERLAEELFFRQGSILEPGVFFSSLMGFPRFLYDILISPKTWYTALDDTQKNTVKEHVVFGAFIVFTILIVSLLIGWLIRRHLGYRPLESKPNYTQKVSAAISMLIAYGLIPGFILGGAFLWLQHNQVIGLTPFGTLLKITCLYALYIFVSRAVISIVFVPQHPQWRLIDVGDEKAYLFRRTLSTSITLILIFSFFQTVAQHMEGGPETAYALKQVANAVKAFCIAWVAWRFLYDMPGLADVEEESETTGRPNTLSFSSKSSIIIGIACILIFLISLWGYVRLAEYILNRLIASVALGGLFYIFSTLFFTLLHQIFSLKIWFRFLRITRRTLLNTEKWLRFLIMPLLGLVFIFLLLALWGASVDIMLQNIRRFLIGFNIGDMHVSIVSIALGIFVFALVMFVVKLLKNSLISGKLSEISLDEGIKGSLIGIIGFLGFLLAVILSVSVMGGSFKGLAIVAGALSFGAGLGLQNIVNNFVSGIIILFERPIKLGDWVIVNGQEGSVRQINMRATHLETGDKATIIIPNATILSSNLTNVTYKNKMGRVDVTVSVVYSSNVVEVEKTLLEIAAAAPGVLTAPPPFVVFSDLSETKLQFQISCYTANIANKRLIANFIRGEILKRFQEKHIEIPLTQQIIQIQSDSKKDKNALTHKRKTKPASS